MAKLYGEIQASALMTFDKSFARSNGQPLDSTEVFYSKSAAEIYAAGEVAYVGQKIVVVETVNDVTKVTHYGIEPDNSLKELGSSPVGDESTITVAEDGTVSLHGIEGLTFVEQNEDGEDVTVTYQPLLTADGLTWVKPSATTVEGLATEIEGLKTSLTAVEGKAHEHSNADVLDGITAEKVATWDAAEENAKGHADDLNTAMNTRVKVLEAIDHDAYQAADTALKSEMETAIATAKSEAVSEAVAAVLGEGVSEDFDTLKEVADWILSDTTGAAALITRVSAIEEDYLKGADKAELQGNIDALSEFVGSLPEGATSTTVVAYIQEVVDGLSIGDYVKASELTALVERITTIEGKVAALEAVGAEKNVIASVDETYFEVDADRKVTLKDLVIGKVTGLQDALDGKADKGTTLAEYGITDAYTKAETEGRIQEVLDGLTDTSETAASVAQDLKTYKESNDARVLIVENKLVTIEEGAQVNKIEDVSEEFEISTDGNKTLSVKEIPQSKVTGLIASLEALVVKEEGKSLVSDSLISKLEALPATAQENVIETVKVAGVALEVTDKAVDITVASADKAGVVKSSAVENGVVVNEDGTMAVHSIGLDKLVQAEGEELVLDGGSSTNV